jgi:hypothetical protein
MIHCSCGAVQCITHHIIASLKASLDSFGMAPAPTHQPTPTPKKQPQQSKGGGSGGKRAKKGK